MGAVSSCDGTRATLEGGCAETKPSDCVQSGIFPVDPCKFRVVSASYLSKHPDVLSSKGTDPTKPEDSAPTVSEPKPSTLADDEHYYYVAYYQDDVCTEPVGVQAFQSGENVVLPKVSNDVSCYDAMACVYDPDGVLCASRRLGDSDTGSFTQFVDPTKTEVVSSCEGTLAAMKGECVDAKPTDCVQSGIFASDPCKFRVVSASYMNENPDVFATAGTDPTAENSSGQIKIEGDVLATSEIDLTTESSGQAKIDGVAVAAVTAIAATMAGCLLN